MKRPPAIRIRYFRARPDPAEGIWVIKLARATAIVWVPIAGLAMAIAIRIAIGRVAWLVIKVFSWLLGTLRH